MIFHVYSDVYMHIYAYMQTHSHTNSYIFHKYLSVFILYPLTNRNTQTNTHTHTHTHTHSRKTPPPGSHHSGLFTQGDGQNPPSEDVFPGST